MRIRLLLCLLILVAGVPFVTAQGAVAAGIREAGVQTDQAQLASAKASLWSKWVAGVASTDWTACWNRGGALMFPLAGLFAASGALALFYSLTIRRDAVVSRRFMESAGALIGRRDYPGLIAVCNREREIMARIARVTMEFVARNPGVSFDEVREITAFEGSREAHRLTHRLRYLADVGAIAPMVGLLGTVIGLIKTFRTLHSGAGVPPGLLRDGVAEALTTTAAGLLIGIPSLVLYSLFRGRTQRLIRELDLAMARLLNLLSTHWEKVGEQAAATPVKERSTGD